MDTKTRIPFDDAFNGTVVNTRSDAADELSRMDDEMTVTPSLMTSVDSSGQSRPAYIDPVVAEKEQRVVMVSRLIMVLVILVAMTTMALTIFMVISKSEKDDFETQFSNYASEMSTVARQNAKTTMDAVKAFSDMATSHAKATNSEWPFVTINDYPQRAHNLAKMTAAMVIIFAPVLYEENRDAWVNHTAKALPSFYEDAIKFVEAKNTTVEKLMKETEQDVFQVINRTNFPENKTGPWLPVWQRFPLDQNGEFDRIQTNLNILNRARVNTSFYSTYTTGLPTLNFVRSGQTAPGEFFVPASQIMQPIFAETGYDHDSEERQKVVAVLWLHLDWATYFENLLPPDVHGIILVLESTCGNLNRFSYQLNGLDAVPLGEGDLHNEKYDYLGLSVDFVTLQYDSSNLPNGTCIPEMRLSLYPSEEFEESFYTNTAKYYTVGVVAIFVFTSVVFGIYDFSVRRRQLKVMERIIRQDKIVSNMFPKAIRDKLYENKQQNSNGLGFHGEMETPTIFGGGPLAELYPCVTVVFADITGFTAWSSAREPAQVFELLENLYGAFDAIAYRHGVFKVETVGDCYVAVGGLPDARDDHAIIVAKFARDCLHKMGDLTKNLEVVLGPDTADLELRLGIHTGQVTAGVLRGERSRFQLFGDTMNTASRMEATSIRSRIQISSATANELKRKGCGSWMKARKDRIAVKGKGDMQTWWLETKLETRRRKRSLRKSQVRAMEEMTPLMEDTSDEEDGEGVKMTKTERLVEWNVEVLTYLLQQIVAKRLDQPTPNRSSNLDNVENSFKLAGKESKSTVLDEFKEIITLPVIEEQDDPMPNKNADSTVTLALEPKVTSELRQFLIMVASMYRPNPFHNFEHASHVTSSVRKLLTRIVNAGKAQSTRDMSKVQLIDRAGHSFGITSDPLTQFAVVFSAIIHDADHPGVPNAQLVKENTEKSLLYKKSIAEQNSVDLVWDLLMKPEYSSLRRCIYHNEEELRRFRQLVVNTVMATDIVDKELQALRKARWETAFSQTPVDSSEADDVNRKATIVIEHLIQASDVSHTMQHWQIYKQWNERFFMECYGAYKAGRAPGDPSIGWYEGEIGFFDFYVIPLAKKLDSCGVFGVSSHEYLNYAVSNREEWVLEGEQLVEDYLRKFEEQGSVEDSTQTDPLSVSLSSHRSSSSELSV